MSMKSARSRVLAAPILELDWEDRLVDALVYGLSQVSIPISGGTARTWGVLVADLQHGSTSDSTESDAFHLIDADRGAPKGTLQLGIHTGYSDAALLHTRLALAVARANGSADRRSAPAPWSPEAPAGTERRAAGAISL